MRTILARYHEEQVWSDKIRSASTYGSLVALGLNMAIFILAIMVVEPWKRRRLAQTFEKKIEEMSVENKAMVEDEMKDLARHFVAQERLLSRAIENNSMSASAQVVGGATDVPPRAAERAAMDRDVATAFAASMIMAGAIGWIARSWLGF
jgi:sensitive to high expression protein 9